MPTETVSLKHILAPSFYEPHHLVRQPDSGITEFWFKGGRGGTKSSFIGIEIFLDLIEDPQAHAFISRRYDNELKDTVFGQMQWCASALKIDHEWRFVQKPMEARNTRTGQVVLFRGVDNPNKSKSIKMPFGYIKDFWAEEVDQYGGMDELRKIEQSILRGEGKGRRAFYSFNPPKSSRSWVNQEVKIPKVGRYVHHSTSYEVPDHWLGEKFVMDREHLRTINEQAWRHEYMGEEVGNGLEVFKNIHLQEFSDEECEAFINVRQGLDWGYAVDPVALNRVSYDRKRRWLYIFGEISGIGIGNRELDDLTPDDWKSTLTRADSSEPKSIDEMRNEYGWNIIKATKGPGSRNRNIKWLAELEKIIIDPTRCPRGAKEFMNYALEVRKGGEVVSEYPDKDNHVIDNVSYASEEWMRPEAPERPQVRNIPTVSHW